MAKVVKLSMVALIRMFKDHMNVWMIGPIFILRGHIFKTLLIMEKKQEYLRKRSLKKRNLNCIESLISKRLRN